MQAYLKSILFESLLFLVAIIWGSGFIVTQLAIDFGASPLMILVLRFLVAFIFLGLVFFKRIRHLKRADWLGGLLTGFFLFGGFLFQTFGLKYTTASNNGFLTAVNVIIVPFIYWIFYRQRPKPRLFVAALIGLLGIGFLTLEPQMTFNIGDFLTLICAFFFAGHIVVNGFYSKKMDSIRLAVLQIGFAFVLSFMALSIFDNPFQTSVQLDPNALLALIYLGVLSTGTAFLLQTVAQAKVNANKTAIILSMEALFGAVFAVLFLKEVLTFKLIIGGLMVLGAIVLAEYQPKQQEYV